MKMLFKSYIIVFDHFQLLPSTVCHHTYSNGWGPPVTPDHHRPVHVSDAVAAVSGALKYMNMLETAHPRP
jgi:hypothetical protein